MHHRLTLMKVGFNRLRRWLTGKHSLTRTQRFQLWLTCVYPIFSYGLFAMGLTSKGLKMAITQLTIMLRQLAHDHPTLTGRNNQDALAHNRLPHPALLMHGTASSLLRTVTQREPCLLEHDLTRTITWTHLPELMQTLHNLQATSLEPFLHVTPEASLELPFLQCQHCNFCTDDISAFRRHCTQAHAQPMYRIRAVEVMHHSENGLPQCRFCHSKFTTWRSFFSHVERGCQVIVSGPPGCALESFGTGLGLTTSRTMQPPHLDAAVRSFRLITANELQHLKQQDFGDKLLHLVSERDWPQIPRDQAICHFLSKRCFICSFQFSRCQELHQHFRVHHSELWDFVPEKALQPTNLHCTESPCDCCGSVFRNHQCPIWTQVAVLLVTGASHQASDEAALHLEQCRCEVCMEVFPDGAQLVQHLQEAHSLQGLSFNPSRDALDNTTACTHCGQIFSTQSGLKSHIVQGRCVFFNPQATAETSPVDERWRKACLEGQFHEVLRLPQTRLHLTLIWQACGRRYQRAADLSLHLQTAHARLWRRSQRLTLTMVNAFYHLRCFCNPALNTQRTHHICVPFRQLAMSFHRMDQEPFAPFVITDTMLRSTLSPALPPMEKHRLEHTLAQRRFADLWQDLHILTTLSCHCLFCGVQMMTADLAVHLHQEHPCANEALLFYMEQLMPIVHDLNQEDFRCQLCRLIYNLPVASRPDETPVERAALSRSHLSGSCPALLQIARLFTHFLLGPQTNHGTRGLGGLGSDDGNVCSPDAHAPAVRPHSEAGSRPQGHKETSARGSRTNKGKRNSRGTGAGPTHVSAPSKLDTAGPSTRSRTPKPSPHGSIHSFFESRTSGSFGPTAEGVAAVETADGEGTHCVDLATPATPDDSSDPHLADSSRPDRGGEGDRSTVQDVSREGADTGGQEFPFSSLGPGPTNPEADPGQTPLHQLSQNAPELGGAPGDAAGQGAHHKVSCPSSSERAAEDFSLASAAEFAQRSPLRVASLSVPELGVDGTRSLHEAALLAPNANGDGSPEHGAEAQGPGKRQKQRQADQVTSAQDGDVHVKGLCALRLINDSHWCYGNSTIHSLLWTLTCLTTSDSHLWGPHSRDLLAFLQQSGTTRAKLTDLQWFQNLLQTWGLTQGQQDCAEFTSFVLSWLRSDAIDMRWERRLALDVVHLHDIGSCYQPITLQFTHDMQHRGHCSIHDLITAWHEEHSMRAALIAAAPCVCCHIDRFYQGSGGTIAKCLCQMDLDSEVNLPVFTSAGLNCAPCSYSPTAAIIHMGQHGAGHCRALLRMQPGITPHGTPAKWLLTEDDEMPQPIWRIPDWCEQNLMVLWLTRTDCLHLPRYQVPEDLLMQSTGDLPNAAGVQPTDALIQMLQMQPQMTSNK